MKLDLTADEAVMLRWLLQEIRGNGEPFKNFEDDTGRDDLDPDDLARTVLYKLAEASPS